MPAARATRLFFVTRPIKFLICGVVIAVAFVDAVALFHHSKYLKMRDPLLFQGHALINGRYFPREMQKIIYVVNHRRVILELECISREN